MRSVLALAAVAALALGCVATEAMPVQTPPGVLFAYKRAPLQADFDATPRGTKVGQASTHFLAEPLFRVPVVAWGDASVEAAVAAAGIETVHYVDYEILNVLIYRELTVRVYGD